MKNPLLCLLLFSCLPFDAFAAQPKVTIAENDAFFTWVEYSYPTLFSPAGTQSRLISNYYVRYYAATNSYLGIREGVVYGHGPAFSPFDKIGGGIRVIGALDNFTARFNESGFTREQEANLIVNEAVAKDPDGGSDWFELYAAGRQAVSLGEYQVKDGKDDRALIPLPDIILQPGEFLVIAANDENDSNEFNVPFKLGSNDRVQLYHNGKLVNELDWRAGDAPEGFSYGRNPQDFSQARTMLPTLGEHNLFNLNDTVPDNSMGAVGTMLSSEVHEIAFTLDMNDYEIMINTYVSSGEKVWIDAQMNIDGTIYEQVGMRLKGNSSLRNISEANDPATLPWLVKLDKFIKNQDHDGLEEFVIRSNKTQSALNEAVALELLQQAGLASQDSVAVALQANNGEVILRLVVEHPDDEWMKETLNSKGALYKAESTGDYRYRGDNPDAYDEVFDQEAGKSNADLSPLINFLQFMNESDDEEFTANLGEHLDTDAFAVYLAMQDLLNNVDDIDGPGNNAYLFFDTENRQFTIIPWDYNLAFNTSADLISDGNVFIGIPIPGSEESFPVGESTLDNNDTEEAVSSSNILVRRFLANEAWHALYQQKREDLRQNLYASGVAENILLTWRSLVSSTGLIAEETIDEEALHISEHFD